MARAVLDRQLTVTRAGRVRFELATESDDAGIRRLLRDSPMPGRIALSLEREPDYFADSNLPEQEKQTVVARQLDRVICTGSCTIRRRFVNGEPRRVGYLGGLRLDACHAGRFDILRRGYEFFRELQRDTPADFYFTSIASDNVRARNFLERGLPGMPRYEFIGEFVTVVLSARRQYPRRHFASHKPPCANLETGLPAPVLFINEHTRQHQFAPCWSAEEMSALKPLGLSKEDFLISHDARRMNGCAALWDQRSFKQTVIRGYAPWLAFMRPALNAVSPVTGNPRLPAAGETLANAFISHLAIAAVEPEALIRLLTELCRVSAQHDIELLTVGFAGNDPRLAVVRGNFRCHEYRSRLYLVRWPDIGGAARDLDDRIPAPEVALL